MPATISSPDTIKATVSLCPQCRREIGAEVYESEGRVYLRKRCPEHGAFHVLINSDRRWYFDSVGADGGCGPGCGCGPPTQPEVTRLGLPDGRRWAGHDPSLIEKSSTCIALIEIVESCNLKCPTCYADSPHSAADQIQALSGKEFWSRVESVIGRKGPIDVLQLSGGEPTLHPRLRELLEQVLRHEGIRYTLLNTNGVRLVQDSAFMRDLGRLHQRHRGFEIYLQFDGPQEAGQRQLRGGDYRSLRRAAIRNCARAGIPVTLAMTVTESNLPHLGDTLRFALDRPAVRGITFQPMFGSGRVPPSRVFGSAQRPALTHEGVAVSHLRAAGSEDATDAPGPVNVADIIDALVRQSGGRLTPRDFTPLPCGDPNCHTIGYLFRRAGGVIGVSHLVDFASMQGFLRDRVNFDLEDLARCGCESEELGRLLKSFEVGPEDLLRLFVKPFMDAWTYDQHRVDRCCVHVIGPEGRLESFCRHYAMKGCEA